MSDIPLVLIAALGAILGVAVSGFAMCRAATIGFRNGIKKALSYFDVAPDLVHYDSDKSWYGRAYGIPLLWDALRSGGFFICDDIQDNLYFKYFVKSKNLSFCVIESNVKFVAVIKKQ